MVPANFTQSDGTGTEPVRLLDTAGGWGLCDGESRSMCGCRFNYLVGSLAGSLGGELLARSLSCASS